MCRKIRSSAVKYILVVGNLLAMRLLQHTVFHNLSYSPMKGTSTTAQSAFLRDAI